MKVFNTPVAMRDQARQWRQTGERVGFVPTMGNLHEGHLSLVRLAQDAADRVVVSIFVNPLQFGPNEDFERYPRTFDADMEKLSALGVDAVFHPDVTAMYPHWPQGTRVLAHPQLAARWEGARRPGHFDGVTTVVSKLFHIVEPDVAAFGQKDFQQLRIIEAMVAELNMPIQILRGPIVREADGLAMSSRNQYLTPTQRNIAPQLYATLQWAREALLAGQDVDAVCEAATDRLIKQGFDAVDYFALADSETLEPIERLNGHTILLATARLGKTRLLDNLLIEGSP